MRFSSRLGRSLDESPWSAHVREARARGAVRFDLTASNPTRVGLGPDPAQSAKILAALSDPRALAYDPHPQGMPSAREAVCAHYAREHGAAVSRERVWLGASTSELYAQLFMLHCDSSSEVLVLSPGYPLFDSLARLVGAEVARCPLAFDGHWMVDADALARAVTDRTRVIVCVSPNNPTGSRLRAHELASVRALCAERGLALIVDEVFAEYSLDASDEALVQSATREASPCVQWTLGGLSKSAGLPQMKLGWAVLSGPEALVREASARFEHVADAFLSASAPVQCAAGALLSIATELRPRILERCRANLALARATLTLETGASALSCEGGWSLVLRLPAVRSEDEWARALLDGEGVLVQPGYFYDFEREAFAVVSLLTEPERFGEALRRIAALSRASL